MSGLSSSLAPIATTQPSTAGKGRVDLVKSDFDAAIVQKGYDVYLDKSLRCPCRRIGDTQPLSSCRNCGGSGYVYINRYKTRMIIQAMNTSTKFKEWSEENIGTVRVTARDEENLSFMDRITMIGAKVISSQIIFPKPFAREVKGKTIYDIQEIDEIFAYEADNKKLVKMEINSDYTFNGNVLTFNAKYVNWENFTVSIRYKHEPTYHIIDMVRESMSTKIQTGSGEKQIVLPISAIGRKSHYVLDEQNYNGDYLFDNSYTKTGCGVDNEEVIPEPTRLWISHPTPTSIVLNWDDPSTTETDFIIERAGLDGVFTQIAVLPANTVVYNDTVLASTTYFYRTATRKSGKQSVWSDTIGVTTNT